MKLLYVTSWSFENEQSNGICKKIANHITCWKKAGYDVDLTGIAEGHTFWEHEGTRHDLGKNGILGKLYAHCLIWKKIRKEKYDVAYVRYNLSDLFFVVMLRSLKKRGTRIVLEIPTYPYDKELGKGVLDQINHTIDKIFRNFLRFCVDRILVYQAETKIWGVPVIATINGIDFDRIPLRKITSGGKDVHILAVANVGKWHGYERLIKGMHNYRNLDRKVYFHIVGAGALMQDYKELVKELELEEFVIFHGSKFGAELDELYDKCDIGVEGFGYHRIGMHISSSLKGKEYAAKGMPIISSCESDIFPAESNEFVLKLPEDESAIDVDSIVRFFDSLELYDLDKKKEWAGLIRERAYKICNMEKTLEPVKEFFLNG